MRIRTSKVEAKDPRTSPRMQIGPMIQISKPNYRITAINETACTANPDHLSLPPRIPLNERHHDWCAEITEAGCYCAHHGNVPITGKFWHSTIIFLKDTEREWEAYLGHISILCGNQACIDSQLPQSNVSNTKAAQSSLQAAPPPSTGASSCSALPSPGPSSSIAR